MSVKAVVGDQAGTQYFIIGLNREDIQFLLEGNVLTLPRGVYPQMTEDSDVVLLFAEPIRTSEDGFHQRSDRFERLNRFCDTCRFPGSGRSALFANVLGCLSSRRALKREWRRWSAAVQSVNSTSATSFGFTH